MKNDNSSKLPTNLSPVNLIEEEMSDLLKKITQLTNQLSNKSAPIAKIKPELDKYNKRFAELQKLLKND